MSGSGPTKTHAAISTRPNRANTTPLVIPVPGAGCIGWPRWAGARTVPALSRKENRRPVSIRTRLRASFGAWGIRRSPLTLLPRSGGAFSFARRGAKPSGATGWGNVISLPGRLRADLRLRQQSTIVALPAHRVMQKGSAQRSRGSGYVIGEGIGHPAGSALAATIPALPNSRACAAARRPTLTRTTGVRSTRA